MADAPAPAFKDPVPSVETRWFFPGRPTPQATAWLRAIAGNESPKVQDPRYDTYLVQPGNHALGVKLREGKLEIKRREADYGLVRWHERAAGRVGRWLKWGFEDPSLRRDGPIPVPGWVIVRKERTQVKFRLDNSGPPTLAGGGNVPRGCAIEITALEVVGEAWWTIACEAFGHEERLRDDLDRAVAHLTASPDAPALEAYRSLDYPEWLARLAADHQVEGIQAT
jgi:hypothetical protein